MGIGTVSDFQLGYFFTCGRDASGASGARCDACGNDLRLASMSDAYRVPANSEGLTGERKKEAGLSLQVARNKGRRR